jgi:hypothetical protein
MKYLFVEDEAPRVVHEFEALNATLAKEYVIEQGWNSGELTSPFFHVAKPEKPRAPTKNPA